MDTTTTPTISPSEFNALLGRADAPCVLDVRRRPRFDESASILARARYCEPDAVKAFATIHPPASVIVYCVHGHNVSADAVATLRAAGWDAKALAGGIEGGQDGADAALDLLATIVRGADTDRLDLAPQSAGLLAISLGPARLSPADDHAMLNAALPEYDALYAWCRERVAARDESHNWKPETMIGARV